MDLDKLYIYRNTTIENLFNQNTQFSGYDEFNKIPADKIIVWFYVLSPNIKYSLICNALTDYTQRLNYVLSKVGAYQTKILFTISKRRFHTIYVDSDNKVQNSIEIYNKSLIELADSVQNTFVFDIDNFLDNYPINEIIDWKYYYMAKMFFSPQLSLPFKAWFNSKLSTISHVRKKCLILDLDNTLWGGILGEEGIDGIKLGGDYPGNAFKDFQQNIRETLDKGVILAICSKNNESDVNEMFETHPEILLKKDDFLIIKANWTDKAQNIIEIAKEINIGLDSLVFVDDNPRERERVKSELPMVEVPEFPEEPYWLYDFFKQVYSQYFQTYKLTNEDVRKKDQYIENFKREQLKVTLGSLDDYIKELDIELSFYTNKNLTRVSQMTQKTNQFNLTTKRYTEAEIYELVKQNALVFSVGVKDKFGDSGITGAAIVTFESEKVAFIDSFLLSCRILGKDIENIFLDLIKNELNKIGVSRLNANYIKTKKNGQTEDFFERNGFTLEDVTEFTKKYHFMIKKIKEINMNYKIVII